jgi:hypothetical protein
MDFFVFPVATQSAFGNPPCLIKNKTPPRRNSFRLRRPVIGPLLLLIAGVMSLLGCTGTAVVLKEDTRTFTDLVDESMTATRAYYMQQSRQRLDVLVDFLAARPSCGVESPLLILTAESRCLTDAEKLQRRDCDKNPNAHANCWTLTEKVREVTISSRLAQPRQTTLSLIGIVSMYQYSLSKVLEDQEFDTAAELKKHWSSLKELKNRIKQLQGDKASPGESRTKELAQQLDAVGALIDLVRDAHQQAAGYAELKALVFNKGPMIERTLEDLLETYEKVDKPFSDLLARREIERDRREYNNLGAQQRARLSFKKRQQLVRAIYQADLDRRSLAERPDALAAGLRGLLESHRKLQEGFKGNLTEAQRKRIARENREQIKAALRAMVGIAKLFV